ncbi:hypothetical protein ABKA04_005710 [Annulohypoxylon sp. FPYF3050]
MLVPAHDWGTIVGRDFSGVENEVRMKIANDVTVVGMEAFDDPELIQYLVKSSKPIKVEDVSTISEVPTAEVKNFVVPVT